MSMTLAGYNLEGPIMNSYEFKTLPGILAVITVWDTTSVLIDIDSGANTRKSVKGHH